MKIGMPAAVLAGGASRRMGRPKSGLPWGSSTLLDHQVSRLADLFHEVFVVVKEPPGSPVERARFLIDRSPDHAAIHGLARALEEAADRIFILAVDLPVVPAELMRALAARSLSSKAPAVVPRADGRLQPLAAVWRRSALAPAQARIAQGTLALHGLAEEVGAEIMEEVEWRRVDPSGNSFLNVNTLQDLMTLRERA